LGPFEDITRRDIRRAQRATLYATFMYGCVLESGIWDGCTVSAREIVEQLEFEVRARRTIAAELVTAARRNRAWARLCSITSQAGD